MILDIYTDASSGTVRKIKIGAIVVDQNDPNYKEFRYTKNKSIFRIKTEMGFKENEIFKANSLIAEMYSIYSILKQLSHLKLNTEKINIYTDSLYSFDICNGISKKIKSKLVKSIAGKIKEVSVNFENIEFMWVRGHSGTWGNEIADALCKNKKLEINEIHQILPK